jgi:hypothetical protein
MPTASGFHVCFHSNTLQLRPDALRQLVMTYFVEINDVQQFMRSIDEQNDRIHWESNAMNTKQRQ